MGKMSIIESDLTRCIICGASPVQLHHTHGGINRQLSDEYGLIVPLCMEHHTGNHGAHNSRALDIYLKRLGQKAFEELYGHAEYMARFGKNYLNEEEQIT